MARMAARATQEALSDLLKHVVETGKTVLVRRGRRDVAAVIPMADLRRYRRLLRAWEDRYWSHAGRVALARFEASGEQPIPWETTQRSFHDGSGTLPSSASCLGRFQLSAT